MSPSDDAAPIDPHEQALLFYLYADDLHGLRDHLVAQGLRVGPIRDGSPGPEREIRISDQRGDAPRNARDTAKGEHRGAPSG